MSELICFNKTMNLFSIDFKDIKKEKIILKFDRIKFLKLFNVGANEKIEVQANTITNLMINSFVNSDLLNDFVNELDDIKIGNLIIENKKKKNKFISEVVLCNKEEVKENNENKYYKISIFNKNIKNIRIKGNVVLRQLPKNIGELEFIDGNISADLKFESEMPDNIFNLLLKNIKFENEEGIYCLIKKVRNQLTLDEVTMNKLDTINNLIPIDVISIKNSNIENLNIKETTKLSIKSSNIKNCELKLHTLSIKNSNIDNIKGNIRRIEIYFKEKMENNQYIEKNKIFFQILVLLKKFENISGIEKIKFKFSVFKDYYVYKKIEKELNKIFNNTKSSSLLKLYTEFFLNNSLYLKKEGFTIPDKIFSILNKTIAYKTIMI